MNTRDRIASIRARNPEATVAEIAAHVGVSKQRVHQLLRKMGMPTATHKAISYGPEYYAWWNMLDRCRNDENRSYRHYGGRGIKVCDEWVNSYTAFFEHVGARPSPRHSLDRIDVNGNYEPGNVRWSTWAEQRMNTTQQVGRTSFAVARKFWRSRRAREMATNGQRMAQPQMRGWTYQTFMRHLKKREKS